MYFVLAVRESLLENDIYYLVCADQNPNTIRAGAALTPMLFKQGVSLMPPYYLDKWATNDFAYC